MTAPAGVPDAQELRGLIDTARVHRRVYVDPALFELEMRRIWGRAWIFVGHESQVPEPGDFITTTVAREPVIMVRGMADGVVRVLSNRCGHRGARLTHERFGRCRVFRCPYHAWCYRQDGSLADTPHAVGYDDTGFDRDAPEYRLDRIPRVASYRGFVFASLSADGPPLPEFLGDTAGTIDNMADRSPAGEIEVVGRVCHQFLHKANWKMFIENLNDAMHPMVAHSATTGATRRFLDATGAADDPPFEAFIIAPFGGEYGFFDDMGLTALRYGHNFMGGKHSIFSRHPLPEDYLAAMREAYGEERAGEIIGMTRHNTTVYPSLAVRDAIQSIRVVRPLAVDRTIIESWVFRLKGAPESMLARNLMYSRLINSPASMVGPEDLDCYERMQQSLGSEIGEWVDQHRFLNQDREDGDGRTRAVGTSDMAFRNQYRAWLDYMLAGDPS